MTWFFPNFRNRNLHLKSRKFLRNDDHMNHMMICRQNISSQNGRWKNRNATNKRYPRYKLMDGCEKMQEILRYPHINHGKNL